MMSEQVEAPKKQMRIALVGISPADQVTIKGYFRILLRLDVELQWVAATDKAIDLFIINSGFRDSASVVKLLQGQQGVSVLYVERDPLENGGLSQNTLILPLKQLTVLHDWLVRCVAVLANTTRPKPAEQSELKTESIIATNTVATKSGQSPTLSAPTQDLPDVRSTDLGGLVELIKKLRERSNAIYELVDGNQVIAVIETNRQRLWSMTDTPVLNTKWALQPYQGQSLNITDSVDLPAWLWQIAWQQTNLLLPLVDNVAFYRVQHWAKPDTSQDRRNLLQVMTAMESGGSVSNIAVRASVSLNFARKVVASLLFCGGLGSDSYDALKVHQVASSALDEVVQKAPEPKTVEQTEKLGFLARLRQKLGL